MNQLRKIRCDQIEYRKGFVEVTPGIHAGCINLETWHVRPEIDITTIDIADPEFPEEGITGNVELEMSVEEADALVLMLQSAILKARNNDKPSN